MGIETSMLDFLLLCKKSGVSFEQTVTLGRQDLLLYPDVMSRCFSKFGYSLTEPEALEILTECDYYADPLFRRLGADAIDSMDHSSFEGATIVHDLNRPIPDELRRRYSAVIDGGTLEHVFNFPQGIKNCMEMVKVGGHILCISPCNNMMGHGFYQFSPELFFRIFSLQYGFEVEAMYINSGWGKGDWFAVSDPDALRRRVGCVTTDQTNVLVRARRVAEVPIFETTPYQSDYSALWEGSSSEDRASSSKRLSFFFRQGKPRPGWKRWLLKFFPLSMQRLILDFQRFRRIHQDRDREAFTLTHL